MKLNLLPATVTRGRASKVAWLMSGIIMIASIVGAVMLITTSRAKLAEAKQREANARPQAQATVDEAAYADTVIAEAAGVIRNTNLATAMIAQNEKYPRLYDSVTRWVPAFYRLTSISAAPGEAPPAGAPPAPAPGTPPGRLLLREGPPS
jgi:hypothetical protein